MQNETIIETILQTACLIVKEALKEQIQNEDDLHAIANNIANNIAIEIELEWGGQQAYIQKQSDFKKTQIYKEFTGMNYRELGRKYHFTERTIRNIIKHENMKKLESKQQKQGTLI